MFKKMFIIILLWAAFSSSQAATGFRQTLLITSDERPLHLTFWYPTLAKAPVTHAGENSAFYGINVIANATPTGKHHPLIVLSHGYGGSWKNLSWLAAALAAKGYIVAAPDHPGTTTADRSPTEAAKLWLRPKDVTRTIDYALGHSALIGSVNDKRIAAIGHSLGGWTVMALAGAKLSPVQLRHDCEEPFSQTICGLIPTLGLNLPEADRQFSSSLQDKRIRAVITLDAGLTRGFTETSLAHLSIPVLVIAAGTNIADLPAEAESVRLANLLPGNESTLHILPNATHFSFMQRCKPDARRIIDDASPGDGIICDDGKPYIRSQLHYTIQHHVIDFLNRALNE